jgi:hypothetical protein
VLANIAIFPDMPDRPGLLRGPELVSQQAATCRDPGNDRTRHVMREHFDQSAGPATECEQRPIVRTAPERLRRYGITRTVGVIARSVGCVLRAISCASKLKMRLVFSAPRSGTQ